MARYRCLICSPQQQTNNTRYVGVVFVLRFRLVADANGVPLMGAKSHERVGLVLCIVVVGCSRSTSSRLPRIFSPVRMALLASQSCALLDATLAAFTHFDPAFLDRKDYGHGAVVDLELGKDRCDMVFDGLPADREL